MGNEAQASTVNEKFSAGLIPTGMPKDTRRHASVSSASTKDRIKIRINESENQQDLNETFIGVNGRAYQIQRGQEVAVPPEVIEALNNAVADKAIPTVKEDGTSQGFTLRPTRRFPYQFVTGEDQKKFEQWKQASLDFRDAQVRAEQEAEEFTTA